VSWVVWIVELGCAYPAGGEPEVYDEAAAFCRACAWTSPMTVEPENPEYAQWARETGVVRARGFTYRAIPWTGREVAA
jgi:hypothetical protein